MKTNRHFSTFSGVEGIGQGLEKKWQLVGVSEIDKYASLDHINGGGTKHIKLIRYNLVGWIIKNNFPKGFQVLCTLCNGSKGRGKECVYHKHIPKPAVFNKL